MSDCFNHEADAWDSLDEDNRTEGDGYLGSPRSAAPYCRHCGSFKVMWIHTGVRWRLFNEDAKEPHRCARVASADDFENLDAPDAKPEPLCAIARETGGEVPLACLFGCARGCTSKAKGAQRHA